MSPFPVYMSCLFLPTETLPWRRTSDLHVMLSVAVVAMLGWRLDRERLWVIFHQEEGRYVSRILLEGSWQRGSLAVFIHTRFFSVKKSHFCLQGIFGSRVDDCLASLVSPLWTVKSALFQVVGLFAISDSAFSLRAPVGPLRALTAVAITVFPFVAWLYYHGNDELRSSWPTHCKTAI